MIAGRLIAAIVIGCLATVVQAQPPDPVRVRLDYERKPRAMTCPDARTVAAAVAGRLGYEPFDPSASERVKVTVTARSVQQGLEARIERIDPSGALSAERVLTTRESDCRELASTMELAIAIAVDPFQGAPPPPPVAHEPGGIRVVTISAPSQAPPSRSPTPLHTVAPPVPVIRHVFIGVVGATGSAPAHSLGIAAGLGGRRGRVSLGLEGRADLPRSVPLRIGDVSASLLIGSAVPCVHLDRWAACALVTGGVLRAAGHGLVDARQVTTPYVSLGARLAADFRLSSNLRAIVHADLSTPLVETQLRVDGQELWSSAPVALALGLDVAMSFP